MPLREGLHERMQCDMRQHFAERYWLHEYPRRHSSWKESTRMKFMNMPSDCSKVRSESSEYMWKTTGVFSTVGESKQLWRATLMNEHRKFWEITLRKTTLFNTCNPKKMETVLKVLRVQFEDDDQRKTAGEIAGFVKPDLIGKQSCKNEEDSGEVDVGYLLKDLLHVEKLTRGDR